MSADVTRTVGAFLCDDAGRVLLGLRAAWKKAWPGHWDCIGGHVEPGESLEEALVRELGEELGVRPTRFRLLEVIAERRPDLYGEAQHHIFAVTAWEGGEPTNVSDEHDEIGWFDPRAIEALTNLADCDYPRLIALALAEPRSVLPDAVAPLPQRRPFDVAAYLDGIGTRPCFICGLVSGDPGFAHHVVYEDEFAIAFLNKNPTLAGYVLVCPKGHLEQVTGDFSRADYLRLQALVFEVSEALRQVLEVERVYILSLGSQQANRHVHWHVAPLPPGVPLEAQQFAALNVERAGVLDMSEMQMAALAARIAEALQSLSW